MKKIESKTSDISSKTSDSKSTGVSGASPKGKGKAGKKGAAAGAKKGKAAAAATAKEDDVSHTTQLIFLTSFELPHEYLFFFFFNKKLNNIQPNLLLKNSNGDEFKRRVMILSLQLAR